MTEKNLVARGGATRRDAARLLAGGAVAALAGPAALAQSPAPIVKSIPKTGFRLPAIGLGSFETFDIAPGVSRASVNGVMSAFHGAGGRVIDTSPLYGTSEAVIGDAAAALDLGPDLFLTTKTWATGRWLGDESAAQAQFDQSRMRLWRDRIDAVLVHSLTNASATLKFLRRLKSEGAVAHLGVTHFLRPYYDALEAVIASGGLDIVQLNYSIFSRAAEVRLLPLAADNDVAVMVNMPFEKARLFEVVENVPLPDWAADIDCTNWAQVFLKYVIGHPAVTCVVPATSDPAHARENMGALYGRLPDRAMRREMVHFMERLGGFTEVLQRPPYPGKSYGGLVQFPL